MNSDSSTSKRLRKKGLLPNMTCNTTTWKRTRKLKANVLEKVSRGNVELVYSLQNDGEVLVVRDEI